jgi:hypothetical protein
MDYNEHTDFVGFSDPEKDRSILKDSMGRFRMNVFYEINKSRHEEYPPLYTMAEESKMGLPSAYIIYMTSASEYEAAIKLLGSWTHWKRYLKNNEFMHGPRQPGPGWEGLASWRQEKEIRDAAKAYTQLKRSAEMGNLQAQKEIWAVNTKQKRGRPSQAEVEKAAAEQAQHTRELKDDLKRIKLVAVNGKQTGSN